MKQTSTSSNHANSEHNYIFYELWIWRGCLKHIVQHRKSLSHKSGHRGLSMFIYLSISLGCHMPLKRDIAILGSVGNKHHSPGSTEQRQISKGKSLLWQVHQLYNINNTQNDDRYISCTQTTHEMMTGTSAVHKQHTKWWQVHQMYTNNTQNDDRYIRCTQIRHKMMAGTSAVHKQHTNCY
jgi:hypothetical protein